MCTTWKSLEVSGYYPLKGGLLNAEMMFMVLLIVMKKMVMMLMLIMRLKVAQ